MLIARAVTFFLFLLLALCMGVWQVIHVWNDVRAAGDFNAQLFILALGPVLLLAEVVAARSLREQSESGRNIAYAVAGAAVLPLTALVAGGLSLIMARGGNHRRIWGAALPVGALLGLNLVACVLAGFAIFKGQQGLALGVACVKVQFFIVVDYFLVRSIMHYFGSAASAFISLRYLRRRVISLLSVVGITAGVGVLIVVNSIMTGFQTDFREQIRGSSSHVLVRFDSEQFRPRGTIANELEWAEFVRRIEADPAIKSKWGEEIEKAVNRAKDAGLNGEEVRVKLTTGRGVTRAEAKFLRDGNTETTAREFYLDRKATADSEAGKKARAAIEEEAKAVWFYPEFRKRMQEDFNGAEKALRAHKNAAGENDIVGVSWRVSVNTVLTPKNRTTELPLAELTGVDLAREPSISSLGDYIAQAETQYFRVRSVLHPLQQVLGALLGFETSDSLQKMGATADFRFTATGMGSNETSFMPRSYEARNNLRKRRFAVSNDKISWDAFDEVRFYKFTPGQALYDRAKEAYKQAQRTYDLDELEKITRDAHHDLRAILQAELDKPAPANDDEAMARMGSKIILEQYLTGIGVTDRQLREIVKQYVDGLTRNLPDDFTAEDRQFLQNLQADLKAVTDKRKAKMLSAETGEAEREKELYDLLLDYARITNAAIDASGTDAARFLAENFTLDGEEAKRKLPLSEESELPPRTLPLAYSVEKLQSRIALVRKRQEAYRRAIPLRTAIRDNESIDEYVKRATQEGARPGGGDLPGIILGEALAESAFMGGVSVGDTVSMMIPRIYRSETGELQPNAIEARFRVTGFFRSGLYEDNFKRMYCDFEELTKLLMDSDVRFIVGAKFQDYTPYEGEVNNMKLKRELGQAMSAEGVFPLGGIGVWEDEKRSLLEAVNREKLIVSLMVGFILVLAGVLIMIVVYQLVSEKVKDIGILKALGHSPWGIRSVFMFNALFIGLFGAIIGAALAIVFSHYLNEIEDFIDRVTGIRLFPPDIYFLTYIPSVKGADLFLLATNIAVPAILWSFACGILPAMSAARKDPIEALHHE